MLIKEQISKDLDFIEERIEAHHHLELLRCYRSGQFIHYSGFGEDWRDRSDVFWPAGEKWKAGDRIGIGATIIHVT